MLQEKFQLHEEFQIVCYSPENLFDDEDLILKWIFFFYPLIGYCFQHLQKVLLSEN